MKKLQIKAWLPVAISTVFSFGVTQAMAQDFPSRPLTPVKKLPYSGNGVAQIKADRLRALAISARTRSSAAPEVPVLSETLKGAALLIKAAGIEPR